MKEKTYNILILDDEKNILNALRRLFRREPYNIVLAQTASEAIEILSTMDTQVIISDYRMPGKNGVDFFKEAKKICPASIRMVLSGYADIDVIINAINEGEIYRFLTKPWNDEELKITIRRAIEQYELMKENQLLTDELQSLNRNLEEKVEERTKELEIRNKILLLSQEIMELLPFAVIGVDTEGLITLVNRRATELFQGGHLFLGERIRESLRKENVDFPEGMDGVSQKIELTDITINGKGYRMHISPLGVKGDVRGSVITFLEKEGGGSCESDSNR